MIPTRLAPMGAGRRRGGYWGLCFTAEQAGSAVAMHRSGSAPSLTLEYSTDAKTWAPFVVGSTTVALARVGDKVWLRAGSGGNEAVSASTTAYNAFSLTGRVAASGKVTSLLNGGVAPSSPMPGNCCVNMFSQCAALTAAPELPSTTLANGCYSNMFRGCTALTAAPALPATTLGNGCYSNMFFGCTALAVAPELPAVAMAPTCYSSMFRDCTALVSAPELPAKALATQCYSNMFYGCTALAVAPELPSTTLAGRCYNQMFRGCTALTAAPALPATTLVNGCYSSMFRDCTALASVSVNFTQWGYTANWLDGVSPTGTFHCPAALGTDETIQRGPTNCPAGWTVVNT